MPEKPDTDEARLLARLATIHVPDERIPDLAAGLSAVRAARAAFVRYDFGLIEPASRFVPPGSK